MIVTTVTVDGRLDRIVFDQVGWLMFMMVVDIFVVVVLHKEKTLEVRNGRVHGR